METLYIVIIVIALVVLLWYIFANSTKSQCISELNGMWIADDEFCQESGIEAMVVYFGDGGANRSKLCWILIMNGKGDHNHITTAALSDGKHIKGKQYKFKLELHDTPDNLFSTDLEIHIVPGQLITIIDPDTDVKIFEGVKNKEASDAIEFNVSESD